MALREAVHMHLARQIGVFIAAALFALGAAAQGQKPSFDVVSIKLSAPGNGPRGGGPRGDRLVMTKVTLKTLLQRAAYLPAPGSSRPLDIIGGPAWMDTDMFDLEAKADCGNGPIDRGRYTLMIQSLLEDRFQLKAHTEPREVPIYELVVAKGGLKMKLSADQTPVNPGGPNLPFLCAPPPSTPPPPPAPRTVPFDPTKMRGMQTFQYAPGSVTVIGNAVRMNDLMRVFGLDSDRPVIDKTNLKELYDFKLQFSPERMATPPVSGALPSPNGEPAAADPVPLLATAIQQQLGLRLEPAKAPIDVLVVESAQKPSEN
jgi:uncharacterized protein (TIGR03435 family)